MTSDGGDRSASEADRDDDLRDAYRRRARTLWMPAVGSAVLWYAVTALESVAMGYGPFVRRPFTAFDWAFGAALAVAIGHAVGKIRRCPRCGHGFGLRSVEGCPACGGRVT